MAGHVICVAQQKGGSGKTTLAVNLGLGFAALGKSVVMVDTDPQGSLGRWFMTRIEHRDPPGLDFTTASAWGVSYECGKLAGQADIVIVDTPPKADSDLRPALRSADLVVVPVASSHVDLWATDNLIDLAERAGKRSLVVLNRARPGTKLGAEVAAAAAGLNADLAQTVLANRVTYAETLGRGLGVLEGPRGPAQDEVTALVAEVAKYLEAR